MLAIRQSSFDNSKKKINPGCLSEYVWFRYFTSSMVLRKWHKSLPNDIVIVSEIDIKWYDCILHKVACQISSYKQLNTGKYFFLVITPFKLNFKI